VPVTRLPRGVALAVALFAMLLLAVSASSARAADAPFPGHKWPRGQVTFYDAAPKAYRWSVDYAVQHLNRIGARVHFTRVSSRRKARLVLRENRRQIEAGLADLGYVKGRRSQASFNKRDRDRYETAMLVTHELGHVLGLEHPRSGRLCSVMNPQFFQACRFKTTQASWVCGLMQPADLRPLQRAYGKRRSTAKSGLCSVFDDQPRPVVGAGLAVADAVWTDYLDPTLPAGVSPVRLLNVRLTWTPTKASAGQHTFIQQSEGTCAEADWDRAAVASSPETENAEYDVSAGTGRDFIYSAQPGARYCYRMQSLYRTPDGTQGPVANGDPVELVVPADPAAG